MKLDPDWCTLWPDGFLGYDWSHCCAVHDIAYTLDFDKYEADVALMECVTEASIGFIGWCMLAGVLVFGHLCRNKRKNNADRNTG